MKAALVLVCVGSAAFLVRALLAPPDYGRRPRLAAVVDGGTMEEFLESESEKEALVRWIADGARERDWAEVRSILEKRCVSCHYTGASFEVLPLDLYEPAARSAEVRPVLEEKITGGTMGKYLETPEARGTLLSWIERGAPESEWENVKAILDAHCVSCHNPEGVQGVVRLDVYRPAARLAAMPETRARPLVVPAAVLVGSMLALGVHGRRNR